jgi:hypothetical protein
VLAMEEIPVSAKFEKNLLVAELFILVRHPKQADGRIECKEGFAGHPRHPNEQETMVLDKLGMSATWRNLSSM